MTQPTTLELLGGKRDATAYLGSRKFTAAMFVFAIMAIAGTRPLPQFAACLARRVVRLMPLNRGMAMYFLMLSLVPLLCSFITEPAAMTLAALMPRDTLSGKPLRVLRDKPWQVAVSPDYSVNLGLRRAIREFLLKNKVLT